jgi:hypothetical protein
MSVKLDLIARGATTAFDRNSPKARQDKWLLEIERAMLASTQPQAPVPFAPVMADPTPVLPEDAAVSLANAHPAAPAGNGRVHHAGTDASARALAAAATVPRAEDVPGEVRGALAVARPSAAPQVAVPGSEARSMSGDAPVRLAANGHMNAPAAHGFQPAVPGTRLQPNAAAERDASGGETPGQAAAPAPVHALAPEATGVASTGGVAPAPAGAVAVPATFRGDAPGQAGAPQAIGASAAVPMDGRAPVQAQVPEVSGVDGIGASMPAFAPAGFVPAVAASTGATGALRAGPVGAASPAVTAAIGPVGAALAIVPGLATGFGAGAPEAMLLVADGVPAEEEHEPAGPARRAAAPASAGAEREPYAPSNVHVIEGEDGTHAWVRDARMTPHQEQAVAQAMIAGFVQQGTLVASVTVNGRPYGMRGEAERDEDAAEPSISEPPSTTAGTTTIVRGAV